MDIIFKDSELKVGEFVCQRPSKDIYEVYVIVGFTKTKRLQLRYVGNYPGMNKDRDVLNSLRFSQKYSSVNRDDIVTYRGSHLYSLQPKPLPFDLDDFRDQHNNGKERSSFQT